MRYRTLYELMDLYEDDEVDIAEDSPVDTDRVLAMTMARLGPRTADRQSGKRPARRWTVRLAIAAALALGLSVTAWAVYQVMIEDYLVETPTKLDAVIEDLGGDPDPGATLSLVGYQGTPEYEAYTEWEAWQAEHYGEHRSDNSLWHETPDNYYELYGAAWQDQADALDQITAKYGVRLHENMAFADAEQIYELLGAKPFLLNEYDWASGYIYNDGTFNLDFGSDHDGISDEGGLFVSVKGTITNISGAMGPGEYEEWSYQTASGPTVDLVLTSVNGHILYETGSAYVYVDGIRRDPAQLGAIVPHTRESLEALADSVDFTELAKVFGEGTSFDLADAVEELDTAHEQKAKEREERIQQGLEENYAASQEIAEELGTYVLVPAPEGYERAYFPWSDMEPLPADGQSLDNVKTDWGATVSQDSVVVDYYSDGTGIMLTLYCSRYYADESRAVSATAEQFEAAKAYYGPKEGFQACQVNGCPGFYYPQVPVAESLPYCYPGVMWLDQARDLVFVLDMTYTIYEDPQTGETVPFDVSVEDFFTPDEMIALAATVTAE